MDTAVRARPRPGGRSEDKRRALLHGALVVFGRDGYTRASIGDIAREAGVSTRTIYNHVRDKAELFELVMVDSATSVAAAQVDDPALAGRHFTLLVATEVADRSGFGSDPLPEDEIDALATAGARAFLRAYRSPVAALAPARR